MSAWLDSQIMDCSSNSDTEAAVSRLVEAGAGLLGRKPQIFGMTLSRLKLGAEEKQAYRERVREILQGRLAELSPDSSARVISEIHRMALGEWLGLVPELVQEPTHRVTVRFRVSVEDRETGEPIFDLEGLRSLDGVLEGDHDWDQSFLHEIPCLEEALDCLTGSRFVLRYDETSTRVVGDLELLLTRGASRRELAELRDVAEGELLYSGWGTNMEFDIREDMRVLVEPEVVAVWGAPI